MMKIFSTDSRARNGDEGDEGDEFRQQGCK